jgi:hypothetical protein
LDFTTVDSSDCLLDWSFSEAARRNAVSALIQAEILERLPLAGTTLLRQWRGEGSSVSLRQLLNANQRLHDLCWLIANGHATVHECGNSSTGPWNVEEIDVAVDRLSLTQAGATLFDTHQVCQSKPEFDAVDGMLSHDGKSLFKLRSDAWALRKLLDAFQRAGWTRYVANPFDCGDIASYEAGANPLLKQTINHFNRRQRPRRLRLTTVGGGRAVQWSTCPSGEVQISDLQLGQIPGGN